MVWYTPHGEKRHNKAHLKHLTNIQYQANRLIIGAYKATSSTPALYIETYTLPIKQKLDWLTSNAMLPIVSSLVYAKIFIDSRPGTQTHLSPLQTLINRHKTIFNWPVSNFEQITPFLVPPWWIPPPITVHHNKQEAEMAHKLLVNELPRKEHCLLIYTDGSGINENLQSQPSSN